MPADIPTLIDDLERDLKALKNRLPYEDQFNEIDAKEWTVLQQHCFRIDDYLQDIFLECASGHLHEMQEDHILGLIERFERSIDILIFNGGNCPNELFRKIAYYGVLVRFRTQDILQLQKARGQKGRRRGDFPYNLLGGNDIPDE